MCNCNQQTPTNNTRIRPECTYTEEQLLSWKDLLFCAKEKDIVGLFEFNSAMGIVQSGLNRPQNICYFQDYLDGITPLINNIINSGQCQ